MTDSLLLVQPVAKLTHNLKGLLLWWWDSQSKLELREKQRTRTDPNSSQHRFTATLPLEQNKEAHVFLSSREIVLRRRLCAVPWQEVVSRLCTHHNRRVNFKTLGAWTVPVSLRLSVPNTSAAVAVAPAADTPGLVKKGNGRKSAGSAATKATFRWKRRRFRAGIVKKDVLSADAGIHWFYFCCENKNKMFVITLFMPLIYGIYALSNTGHVKQMVRHLYFSLPCEFFYWLFFIYTFFFFLYFANVFLCKYPLFPKHDMTASFS